MRWRKRKKRRTFSCVTAITGAPEAATAARLRFDVIYDRAKKLGISKGALAHQVEVNPSTMWRYSQGMEASFDVACRIAEAIGLPVDALRVQGNPTPKPAPGPSSPRPAPAPRPRSEVAMPSFLSVDSFAAELEVDDMTVRRMIDAGLLKAINIARPGSKRLRLRIPATELVRIRTDMALSERKS